jgi:ketosteroid isomerase-like protein
VSQPEKSIFLPEQAKAEHIRNLVGEILGARGEPLKMIDYFHDDCIFHVIGTSHDYSFSGDYYGRDQILGLLRRIDTDIEMQDHRILNVVIDGDTVGLRRSTMVRHRGTSARARLLVGNFVRLRDDRIAEISEYVDTCWLKRMLGEDE